MVANVKRDFRDLMVVPEINYREIHPTGIIEKIAILYLSSVDETEDVKGSGPRGWLSKEPAEIVSLDNPAIYECPALQDIGVIDAKTLREHYRGILEAKRDAAMKDTKKEYKAELVAVYNEMLEAVDRIKEVVVGGIHRGMAFPDVVAKWRFDQKRPDKGLHYKHSEAIPCELLSPDGYTALFAVATERNSRAMSQLGYTFVDLVVLAYFVLKNLMKHQTYFRTFIMTGNPRATAAEVERLKKDGTIKDGGSRYSLPWAIAECANAFPELEIIKRLKISEDETDPELKAKRIDASRLMYGPLDTTDVHRNVNYFRACASKELADDLFSAAQTKNRDTHGAPGTEPAECFRKGIYWTAEQRAAWWDANCPEHPSNAKGMPTQENTAKVVADTKRIQGVAKGSDFTLVKLVADNLLDKGGKDATIADFQTQNRMRLMASDAVFKLLESDAAASQAFIRILSAMQAVKDKSVETFRSMLADVETVINEAVTSLKGSDEPKSQPEQSPPKGASKSPPKGASKSPPKGASKSPKKAASRKS